MLDLAAAPAAASFDPPHRGGIAVTVRGLSKDFGSTPVLRDIDLHVPAGQFVVVVGRSGSGKSTLLRILAGLDAPSTGRMSLGEAGEAAGSRIMFQEPRLLPWARVLANVEVGLGPEPGVAGRERALAALRQVGLENRAGDWPSVLSGGQKQRVALARALVSRPKMLALDEPLGAVDALTRIEMQGLIERIWQAEGFTALLVTHDVAEAASLADRVVLIDEGRVALDLMVDLPRPRRRGSAEFGRIEARILQSLFANDARPAETVS